MERRNYWAWSTHPTEDHVEALDGGYGWWTCHEDTRQGDLVVVYLTSPDRHVGYLVEAASNATLVRGDPRSPGEWDNSYACDFITHARFAQPLTLKEMKGDRLLASEFTALRGNFQQRSYAVPVVVWDHLIGLLIAANPTKTKSVQRAERHRVAESVLLEKHIEDALESNLAVLRPDWDLRLEQRQFVCSGIGFIDLLCHDDRGPVVVELKRNRATVGVVAQITSYMGWVRENRAHKRDKVRGIVISDGYDRKFQLAMGEVPDLYHVELDSISSSLGIKR